jgi:chromosome segregation ATPase
VLSDENFHELRRLLEGTSNKLDPINSGINDLGQRVAILETESAQNQGGLASIRKTLSEGNGRPSLIEQLATLSSQLNSLDARVKELESKAQSQTVHARTVWLALLAGGLSFLVSVFEVLVKK